MTKVTAGSEIFLKRSALASSANSSKEASRKSRKPSSRLSRSPERVFSRMGSEQTVLMDELAEALDGLFLWPAEAVDEPLQIRGQLLQRTAQLPRPLGGEHIQPPAV